MKYRKLGPDGPEVSALGFGVMRMPAGDDKKIDRETGRAMLLESFEAGVNYWDTAWPYHDGDSETFISEVFRSDGGPNREDIVLATKLPSWLVKTRDDLDKYFNAQLERLGTDYFDVYLLHSLNREFWTNIRDLGVLDWLEGKKKSGQIRQAGFSFHDSSEMFMEILGAWDWDLCQIQYNYMDENEQAGRTGLRAAHEKGIGVIIMEPIQGGNLVTPPASVAEIWAKSAHPDWSPVERALRWLWDQEEVALVLSGMSTMGQVKENCAVAAGAGINELDDAEKELFADARDAYIELKAIGCTGCKYCLPCPQDVDIPRNFAAYNQAAMYGNLDGARGQYTWMKTAFDMKAEPVDPRAENCISCGECEPKCPQQLKIATLMPEVAEVLSGGKEPADAGI